jgi:hypothetical protein
MNISFTAWLIYVPIGCRHPFIEYCQPLLGKITAKPSQPHPEIERQQSVNGFSYCTFGNQVIALIFALIMELLTAIIGNNTIYQR